MALRFEERRGGEPLFPRGPDEPARSPLRQRCQERSKYPRLALHARHEGTHRALGTKKQDSFRVIAHLSAPLVAAPIVPAETSPYSDPLGSTDGLRSLVSTRLGLTLLACSCSRKAADSPCGWARFFGQEGLPIYVAYVVSRYVLSALAPQLPATLPEEALRTARAIEHDGARAHALARLIPQLALLPRQKLYLVWSQMLHCSAQRVRRDFLAELAALAPLLSILGGPETVVQAVAAIQTVSQWWP